MLLCALRSIVPGERSINFLPPGKNYYHHHHYHHQQQQKIMEKEKRIK